MLITITLPTMAENNNISWDDAKALFAEMDRKFQKTERYIGKPQLFCMDYRTVWIKNLQKRLFSTNVA